MLKTLVVIITYLTFACLQNGSKMVINSSQKSRHILNRHILKTANFAGLCIRILQHFATKLWNITNFVMLFQAVMKFLSRSKF